MKEKTVLAILVLSLVVTGMLLVGIWVNPGINPDGDIKTFKSYEELEGFVSQTSYDGYGYAYAESAVGPTATAGTTTAQAKSDTSSGASDYSETNIQIEGVDEPDIVKNDGKYIYVVSGKKVIIVNAYPAENMEILSEIEFDNYVNNIFINDDKLIVFSQGNEYIENEADIVCIRAPCGGYSTQKTMILVYDIADREEPELKNEFVGDGSYRDARMIGDYVYVVSSNYIYPDRIVLPMFEVNGVKESVDVQEIRYFDNYDSGYVFSSIMSIDLDGGDFEREVFLTGNTNTLFVSENNIYLTGTKQIRYEDYQERMIEDVILKILPRSERNQVEDVLDSDMEVYEKMNEIGEIVQDYSSSLVGDERSEFDRELEEKLEEFQKDIAKETEKTIIHKIEINEGDISYKAKGEAPGTVLNQFSMDEHEGNLRIATTTGGWRVNNLNHLFVLDEDLDIIGSVEDLAKDERIYSVRFIGDKAYMVTFRQVDPLFVIDLSNPNKPEVLGFLKVTGFSSYLHPYDENHIIGIGKEATEQGRVQGVKIALFDISDFENPKEVAKYEVEEKWSDSNALYDHKAFLFDRDKNLLVLPMSYSKEIGLGDRGYMEYEHWQGAYVFDIDKNEISLKGKISHKPEDGEEGYYYGPYAVQRSLYMDDVLYTISRSFIKANDLSDLDFVEELELPYEEERYYDYSIGGRVIPEIAVGVVIE